jgi:hypothetical protein
LGRVGGSLGDGEFRRLVPLDDGHVTESPGTVSRTRDLVDMPTFETTDPKVAIRCRYDQHRSKQTTLTIQGSLIMGLVHSVMEVKRWIITVVAKPRAAA